MSDHRVHEAIRGLGLGGAETLLTQRIEIRHQSARGESRSVLNCAPSHDFFAERLRSAGVKLETTGSDSVLVGIWRTYLQARTFGPEVIVVAHSPAASIGFKLYAATHRRRRFTLVEVVHNTQFRQVYMALARALNRFTDLGICVSVEVAHGPTSVGYPVTAVVLGGVDGEAMRDWRVQDERAAFELRATVGVTDSDRLIVNVGNLTRQKNQESLIRAMLNMPSSTHLALAGDGPLMPDLQDMVRRLGLGDRVHLLGREPDAWRWIAAADLMAHPSLHEGLPVVLMEALCIGTPIVASRFGGIQDIISHGGQINVVDEVGPAALAERMTDVMASLPGFEVAWPLRLTEITYWDVRRFVTEYYQLLEQTARDRQRGPRLIRRQRP